jgi:hypothetical protein
MDAASLDPLAPLTHAAAAFAAHAATAEAHAAHESEAFEAVCVAMTATAARTGTPVTLAVPDGTASFRADGRVTWHHDHLALYAGSVLCIVQLAVMIIVGVYDLRTLLHPMWAILPALTASAYAWRRRGAPLTLAQLQQLRAYDTASKSTVDGVVLLLNAATAHLAHIEQRRRALVAATDRLTTHLGTANT